MKQGRSSEEKIAGIPREAEKGEKPIDDLCREHAVAEQTFCRRLGARRRATLPSSHL